MKNNSQIITKKGRSLTFKILITALGLQILTSAINAVQFQFVLSKFNSAAESKLTSFPKNLGSSIAAQFYERYGDVQTFATNSVFQTQDKKQIVDTLNKYSKLYGIYDLILFVDNNGKLIATNNKDTTGKEIGSDKIYEVNFLKAKWFKDAMEGNFLEDNQKGFTGTVFVDLHLDPIVSEVYGGNKYTTLFAAPIKDAQGKSIGVICNRANFKWVEDLIPNFYESAKSNGYPHLEAQVINKQGLVLLDFDTDSDTHLKVVEDPNVILKENYLTDGYEPAKKALAGEEGILSAKDPRHHNLQVAAFSPIRDAKFLDQIGWGITVRVDHENIYDVASSAQTQFYSIMFGIFLVAIFINWRSSKQIGFQFLKIAEGIKTTVEHTSEMGHRLSDYSLKLSSASQEQASSIQESVSALSEMGSMIAQTGQNVNFAVSTSKSAQEQAKDGVQIMTNMTKSMNSIQQSNEKLQEISVVIENISNKTNVINEIVFKTQLLSFNASIEAARAGQHGRGFAVVAEEVGSLAEMSGQAAREIESLLDESKTRVSDTLDTIRARVQETLRVSEKASTTFSEITAKIIEVSDQMDAITEATKQQDIGIQQTNSAMKQLDLASQMNHNVSLDSQKASSDLTVEAGHLKQHMETLFYFVKGGRNISKSMHLEKSTKENPVTKTSDSPSLVAKTEAENKTWLVSENGTLDTLASEIVLLNQQKKTSELNSVQKKAETDSDEHFKKMVS